MKRYSVVRVIGDVETILGVYGCKEEMLKEKERFSTMYRGMPGVVCGIYAEMDEQGNRISQTDCDVFGVPFRVF